MKLAAVVIGRNEGTRLIRCFASLEGRADPIIYVDSGSTDGSVAAAEAAGAQVIALDMSLPFTAARARNAGLKRLKDLGMPDLVQLIDGDCELQPDWTEQASDFLSSQPKVAIVAGRLRERSPEVSVWNRLADAEWDTPTGQVDAVGGIAVIRARPVDEVGGFREDLIAGEEPELCLRLHRAGWAVWRLPAEMALHDIAMTRFGQWWKRMRRYGHAIAEGWMLHGGGPEAYCRNAVLRNLMWGAGVPIVSLFGALFQPWWLIVLLAWPAQVLRLRAKGENWERAFFLMLGKIPIAQGILSQLWRSRRRTPSQIIEYK